MRSWAPSAGCYKGGACLCCGILSRGGPGQWGPVPTPSPSCTAALSAWKRGSRGHPTLRARLCRGLGEALGVEGGPMFSGADSPEGRCATEPMPPSRGPAPLTGHLLPARTAWWQVVVHGEHTGLELRNWVLVKPTHPVRTSAQRRLRRSGRSKSRS